MAQGDVSSKLANLTILINFWIIAIPLEPCINPSRIISRFSIRHCFHYILGTSTKIVFCRSTNNKSVICLLYAKRRSTRRYYVLYYILRFRIPKSGTFKKKYSKILSKMCWFRIHLNITYGPYTLCSEVIFQSLSSSSNKSRDLTHKTDHVLS